MNLYQYCLNNPINYFDPWGLSAKGSGSKYEDLINKWREADEEWQRLNEMGFCPVLRESLKPSEYDLLKALFEDAGYSPKQAAALASLAILASYRGAEAYLGADIDEVRRISGLERAAYGVVGGAEVGGKALATAKAVAGGNKSGGYQSRGSTGQTNPSNLKEQLAMEQVKSNPGGMHLKKVPMTDPRWPASQGWQKWGQNVNGVEIHYNRNIYTGQVDDFKFK